MTEKQLSRKLARAKRWKPHSMFADPGIVARTGHKKAVVTPCNSISDEFSVVLYNGKACEDIVAHEPISKVAERLNDFFGKRYSIHTHWGTEHKVRLARVIAVIAIALLIIFKGADMAEYVKDWAVRNLAL